MLHNIYENEELRNSLKRLEGSLPTVLILTGGRGVGKKHTAYNFIDEIYSGKYSDKLDSLSDIKFLEPDTKTFKLSLVDEIKSSFLSTPFEIDRKFYILRNADLMNKEAANACLKMFEDSPPFNHFILLVENIDLILPTIISRSVVLGVNPLREILKYKPDLDPIVEKIAGGCLGLVKEYADIDLKKLYESTANLIKNFENITYGDIILWLGRHEEFDIPLLVNIMSIVSIDLIKKGEATKSARQFLRSCNKMKDKIKLNLSQKMHFKFGILENKSILMKV